MSDFDEFTLERTFDDLKKIVPKFCAGDFHIHSVRNEPTSHTHPTLDNHVETVFNAF